ncbi:MAG: hypothetical protein KYX68_08155 [Flavobacterium sp.]|nr:hypothetical protein [Flavobacterium sp.]
MKKKQINIALIIIVLALWGTVFYKYVNRFFSNDNEIVYNQTEFSLPITKIEKDTFELKLLERDPFLAKTMLKRESNSIVKKALNKPVFKKTPVPIINKPFPIVQYFGYIKSQDKNQKLILLKVNDRLKRVRLKDNIDGLVVEQIYKDSVVLRYNNSAKSISKLK